MGVPLNIDWQQILLHLFNFLILAGGLYLLLYKPVKRFMDKRATYYKDMDNAANEKIAAAENTERQYADRLADVQEEIGQMKKKALEEAEQTAQAYLADANEQKCRIIQDAKKAAQAEKEKIMQEANAEIEGMVSAAMDKMLVSAGENSLDNFLDRAEKEE